MPPIRDLRGQTFGLLTVAATAQPVIRHGSSYWPCRCDCGREVVARGSKLLSGRVKSCGCYRASPDVRRTARLQTPARRRRAIAKSGAKARWREQGTR